MYYGIQSQGGIHGGGMVYASYFIVLVLFGNCILYWQKRTFITIMVNHADRF